MIERIKKKTENPRPAQAPTKGGREIAVCDSTTSAQDGILFTDDAVLTAYVSNPESKIEHDGKMYYSLERFGVLCGYRTKDAAQVYDRNKSYFSNQAIIKETNGNLKDASTCASRKYGEKVYLTSHGLFVFVSRLELTKLSKERQDFILKAVNYMAESADMRSKGELLSQSELEGLVDTRMLSSDVKIVQKFNKFRIEVFDAACNQLHPSSPNTVKRRHELFHNDQAVIQGPDVPFKAGWHLKLRPEDTLKKSCFGAVTLGAISVGMIDKDRINAHAAKIFGKGISQEFIPDFLPRIIETSKQYFLGDFSNEDCAGDTT